VSENATVEEHFVFDPNGERFTYDATYTDPTVLTRPFTITIPNRRITGKTPVDDSKGVLCRSTSSRADQKILPHRQGEQLRNHVMDARSSIFDADMRPKQGYDQLLCR
jgi:hypothetical protein